MNTPVSAIASRRRASVSDALTTGLSASRGAHISLLGGRFALVNAAGNKTPVNTLSLDVVIVAGNPTQSKIYFEGSYDGTDAPPVCFSDNGTGPSVNAITPQAPTCAVCPHNVNGSKISEFSGKGIKSCSDRKKMAVIVDGDPELNVYEFQIPPASLTPLRKYIEYVSQQMVGDRRMDVADVVTRVGFDVEKPNVLTFAPVAMADDERSLQVIEYIDANHLADGPCGLNDKPADPATVAQMVANRPQQAQLAPPPAGAAQQAPNVTQMPQRAPAAPAPALPAPAAQPAAPRAPARRRAPAPQAAPANGASQFVAQAQPTTPAPIAPMAQASPPDLPEFLKRAPDNSLPGVAAPHAAAPVTQPATAQPQFNQAPAPGATQPRFGIGTPPAAPPGVGHAFALPTRR